MNWRRYFDQCLKHNLKVMSEYIYGIGHSTLPPEPVNGPFELCVLDYGSTDGVAGWIKRNFMQYISCGLMNFYRFAEPKHYHMTRAKNMAHKLGRGRFVINLDGDNLIPNCQYLHLLQIKLQNTSRVVLSHGRSKLRGRIGFYKTDFIKLGGYDEVITNYARGPGDDRELYSRAVKMGLKPLDMGRRQNRKLAPCKLDAYYVNRNYRDGQRRGFGSSVVGLTANVGKTWGGGQVIRNFKDKIEVTRES